MDNNFKVDYQWWFKQQKSGVEWDTEPQPKVLEPSTTIKLDIAPMPSWPAVKGGNSSTGPGPTVSLGKTFRAIGWTPLPDGFLQHALGFELNWVPCSVTFLKYWLCVLWTTNAALKAQSRKDVDIT